LGHVYPLLFDASQWVSQFFVFVLIMCLFTLFLHEGVPCNLRDLSWLDVLSLPVSLGLAIILASGLGVLRGICCLGPPPPPCDGSVFSTITGFQALTSLFLFREPSLTPRTFWLVFPFSLRGFLFFRVSLRFLLSIRYRPTSNPSRSFLCNPFLFSPFPHQTQSFPNSTAFLVRYSFPPLPLCPLELPFQPGPSFLRGTTFQTY